MKKNERTAVSLALWRRLDLNLWSEVLLYNFFLIACPGSKTNFEIFFYLFIWKFSSSKRKVAEGQAVLCTAHSCATWAQSLQLCCSSSSAGEPAWLLCPRSRGGSAPIHTAGARPCRNRPVWGTFEMSDPGRKPGGFVVLETLWRHLPIAEMHARPSSAPVVQGKVVLELAYVVLGLGGLCPCSLWKVAESAGFGQVGL